MISFRSVFAAAVLTAVVASSPSHGQAETPAGITKVTSIEGFTEYRLENGMRVLLLPDPGKPIVTINNVILVGSRHEGYGEAGMAHLLEHMLFKGTPDHPQVPKALQERGAQFNGTTWVDRTNYYETLPASDDNLEFAIRLEADRMMNSFVKAEDLASEMTVVRNEFERGENDPYRVLTQKMASVAYEWHNYGQSTIGNRADIERVPIDKLKAFYKKYYQPDNAVLIIAGQFDEQKALDYVAKYFGAIPRPERVLDNTYTEEPAQDGERLVTLRRVGEVPLVGVQYHIPPGSHPDYVSLDVLESILTMSPSGRLYKALVETKKASSINGVAFAWHDPGIIRFVAKCTEGNSPQVVLGVLIDELDKVGTEGVSEEEVERAKTRLLKQFEMVMDDSQRLAIEMTEWLAQGDWRLFFLYRDGIEKVTPASVQEVAKNYLQQNNRTVGFFIPTEKPSRVSVPQRPVLAELIGDYKGREVAESIAPFDVSPENIEERTTRLTLESGLQAALLPKETRGNQVNLRLVLRFGNEENLKGLVKETDFLGPMLLRGTKNLSRQEIQDQLDKLGARINISSSVGSITVAVQAKRESLPATLEILRQVLREPTFPETELDILRQAEMGALQQRLSDPTSLATRAVSRRLNPYPQDDPRYISTVAEEIEETRGVERETLAKLYEEYLGGQNGELAVVGDFDSEVVVPIMNKMLTDWTAKQEYKHIARTAEIGEQGGTDEILTPDKENAIYFAGMLLPMQDNASDYPALLIGDFIFGGGSLSSRLGDRIRQKEGLSYGVGSNLQASSVDKRASITLYAISNPQNIPKVKTAMLEELMLLLDKGISEEELAKAKQGYLQKQDVNRSDDSALARDLQQSIFTNRTMLFTAQQEQQIADLTVEQVNAAVKKWLDPKKFYIVTAGDLNKAETTSKTE